MPFFVEPNEGLDHVTDNMARDERYADRYDAIKELREISQQGLSISPEDAAKANGFFRVASLQGPIKDLAVLLDPEWMKNKKNFYRWLDKHPQHCAYDRRRGRKV